MGTKNGLDGGRGRRLVGFRLRGGKSGLSLVELTIVVTVVLFTFLAMSRSLGESMQLNEVNRENALATDAAREMIELLAGSADFRLVFFNYNEDPTDDPGGFGTAPGNRFAVFGLGPDPDDPDGMVGTIDFPTVTLATGRVQLHEEVDDPGLGMPRDLNGSGGPPDGDASEDYVLLPVRILLRWKGARGLRTLELRTLLAER